MKNKLVNSIDLNLSNSELRSLISDVKFELAFVVDSNHRGTTDSELNEGEVLAKSLDTAGTSELSDTVYKPLNKNISHYPIAGEFILVMKTSVGRYYLSSINLFNSTSNNIDKDNVSGYVRFKDDDNINETPIKKDKRGQKSVLENNEEPFTSIVDYPIARNASFGDVGLNGRYGNSISLSKSNRTNSPEINILNSDSKLQFTNGWFVYPEIATIQIPSNVSTERGFTYDGQQIYGESQRIHLSARDKGIFLETSGMFSVSSNDDIYLTSPYTQITSNVITLGGSSLSNRAILGDVYLRDFESLMNAIVRFAENLKSQERILSVSIAAENFLTDINNLGWGQFTASSYLSGRVYIE